MLTSIIGFFSGILGGMGVGGGMLLIPAATMFLSLSQHKAQSLNLFCFIPSALCAIIVHIKNKNISFKTAIPIIITGVPLALLGAYISTNLSSRIMGKLFGLFILIFGIKEICVGIKAKKKRAASPISRPD